MEISKPTENSNFTNNGGVIDYYKGGIKKLFPSNTPTKKKFTYELSDHLPLWTEINVDMQDEKLDQIIQQIG